MDGSRAEAYTPAVHGEHADGLGGIVFSHRDVFEGRYSVVSDAELVSGGGERRGSRR